MSTFRRIGSIVLAACMAAFAVAGCGSDADRESTKKPNFHTYRSRPDLRPPLIVVTKRTRDRAPGYLFASPKKDGSPGGSLILDDRGDAVWFQPLNPRLSADFRVQRYRGRPVLTWWEGTWWQRGPQPVIGIGVGKFVILDNSYRRIAEVRAGNGLRADLHEFVITPRNTALVVAYPRARADLSGIGGRKKSWVFDNVVQEVDIATGRVLFEWRALEHVPVAESALRQPAKTASAASPFDYFHVNSINLDTDGNLIVSARNTHAVYKISRQTGKVLWRLGGKASDFSLRKGTKFAFQHDAQRQPDGTISLFDNSAIPKVADYSRALFIRLDMRAKVATLRRALVHPRRLLAPHQGNVQRLPNGHFLVGWGGAPYFTEYDARGRVLFDGRLVVGDTYRTYRFPWTGRPLDRPAVAARSGDDDQVTVYASWNGATEVARWEVVAGPSRQRVRRVVGSAPKRGFETAIRVQTGARYVAVRALDAAGNVLRVSRAVVPRQA